MKSIILITDVPTPYRIHLFNLLAMEFSKRGFELVVWYFARTVSNRNWVIDEGSIKHRYEVFKSREIRYNNYILHFNVSIIFKLYAVKDGLALLLVGASWNSPANVLFFWPIRC